MTSGPGPRRGSSSSQQKNAPPGAPHPLTPSKMRRTSNQKLRPRPRPRPDHMHPPLVQPLPRPRRPAANLAPQRLHIHVPQPYRQRPRHPPVLPRHRQRQPVPLLPRPILPFPELLRAPRRAKPVRAPSRHKKPAAIIAQILPFRHTLRQPQRRETHPDHLSRQSRPSQTHQPLHRRLKPAQPPLHPPAPVVVIRHRIHPPRPPPPPAQRSPQPPLPRPVPLIIHSLHIIELLFSFCQGAHHSSLRADVTERQRRTCPSLRAKRGNPSLRAKRGNPHLRHQSVIASVPWRGAPL